jgi:hypothetical protein
MRVTIVGIDGLDYDIVEEMDLRYLKQQFYTKLSIPDECYIKISSTGERTPWTPLCWMAIITGRTPQEELIPEREEIYKNKLIESLRWKLGPYLSRIKGKRKFLRKLGFINSRRRGEKFHTSDGPISRKINTIFNLVDRSINFNIPTYSETFRLKPKKKIDGKELLGYMNKESDLMKEYTLSVLNRKADYDLFMTYTRILDGYGHQSFRTEIFYNHYRMMDLFMKEVSEKIDEALLIISDHGFQKLEYTKSGGKHSDEAYFSSNTQITTKIDSLLDVYNVVHSLINQ